VSWWLWPLYFATGLIAGFVDSIAGGGGLITLPVLLGTGKPPLEALATNKLQATFGSASAVWHYHRARAVRWADVGPGVMATAAGALAGVCVVSRIDPSWLRRIIPLLLLIAAAVVWLRPAFGMREQSPRFSRVRFQFCAGSVLGFYDGFFGPGTGTFWTLALVFGLGLELLRATAWTKAMNFTSNIVSLVAFAGIAKLDWVAGLLMGTGQAIGARWGARYAVRGGAGVIRPIFLAMILVAAAKLIYDGWFGAT
jgi:uncharacterized membrane protein YfcA